eukprot:CAMPEP_0178412288 /NCGR_PEP_ID=MMETSP0689_2-20121128/21940_1 /TAXON_ID=160604 /ORGANISM="Amphidinium massartii, Strain CS-259" /LENGTH=626 /DNA_ID=CAMNT_0020033535 /DNA_START=42 /DNA_END=1922 /DNA_ORIENTATION=-
MIAAALAFASLVVCGLLEAAEGHGYVVMPPLRGGTSGNDDNGYCPHCGNGAGVCGDGGQWPDAADFLNYGAQAVTNLQAGIQEFEVYITAHHRGHFEFAICDQHVSGDLADPQACFDAGKLRRADRPGDCVPNDARGDCQPIQADYPERWYLPPGTGTHRMRFVIPADLPCSSGSCTLQWRWWTGNSCAPAPNYGCFYQALAAEGWDANAWCGDEFCGTCGEYEAGYYDCGEQFRNCADVAVVGGQATTGESTSATPQQSSATVPGTSTSAATSQPSGVCAWNRDCTVNAWCNDPVYEEWCPQHQEQEACPSPQCIRMGATQTGSTPATSTAATTATPSTSPGVSSSSSSSFLGQTTTTTTTTTSRASSGEECVSQAVLECINDASSYWPRCSPTQSKSNAGPAGYEFGLYCTEQWAEALNEMLRDPLVGRCSNITATHNLLAQIAYETGYYSTLYQPIDGGAGLIHMIPQNWPINVGHMDALWPGMDYISKLSALQEKFFQTPAYGWRSVAAWYLSTNHVIPGCEGKNLFELDMDGQTRCILGRVVDRSEAYNIVGQCLATVSTMSSSAASSSPQTSATTTPSAVSCVPIGDCGVLGFCDQQAFESFCESSGQQGLCPEPFCMTA